MTGARTISLLGSDPDLGALCGPQQLEAAERSLVVRHHRIEPGQWDGERLREAGPEHIGLLVIDGLMARELALSDNVSGELIGPGDLVRPWRAEGPDRLVPLSVRWTVLEPTRVAVLDRRFAAALTRFPEVNAMLIDRISERAQRLAVMQAISQLNGVDRRLLTLFWHLAERWGHVTSEGVRVPIAVPHRIVAQLVGARRPTVSTALGMLAERGELVRQRDGAWLLTGAPVGFPTESAARIIRRRRVAPTPAPAEPRATTDMLSLTGRIGELYDELTALREESERSQARFDTLRDETIALLEEIAERPDRSRAGNR